jgi:peptide-methionine (S)-S-oxide reductase
MNEAGQLEKATFASGCFWCTEAVFQRLIGVEKVLSGYIGGQTINPSYDDICTGQTGHAEAVQITFDPNQIDYNTLLKVFFTTHNPCTLNRQGADIGTQYRSAIFYHNEVQAEAARQIISNLETEGIFDAPIVTEVTEATSFYSAEHYHQNYYNDNRSKNSYCMVVIDPKMNTLRKQFAHLLKPIA